jgi:protein AbiQ
LEKSKITLIKVKEHYINYLSQFDKNVRFNKSEKRIYVGALLIINEIQYFAPLASPKDKHKNLSEGLTILKIKNGVLGIVNLNNMIPLKEDVITDLEIFIV